MEDYGVFQDKGVKGKDPSKVSKNAKIKGQQAPNSPTNLEVEIIVVNGQVLLVS
jgi:hypothetical protein